MQLLDPNRYHAMRKRDRWFFPRSVDAVCPNCHRTTNFPLDPSAQQLQLTAMFGAICPRCDESTLFLIMGQDKVNTVQVWMHPSASVREALDLGNVLPLVAEDYQQAVAIFNDGHWRAAAQSARIVLEGVVAQMLGSSDPTTPLAQRLRSLPGAVDLGQPIADVAEVIKDGGNLASHFREGATTSRETAAELLDLIDSLIEYLLLLPARTAALRVELDLTPSGSSDGPDAEE